MSTSEIDWASLVMKSWGKEWSAPEIGYRFSNGRTFDDAPYNFGTDDDMSYWVQAETYGASPSASASANTAAFQSALDSIASTGGVLIIAAGSFQLDGQLVISGKIRLQGAGSSDAYSPTTSGAYANQGTLGATRLVFTDGTIDCVSVRSTGVAMRDIHFSCSATATAGSGVQVGTASIEANGFHIANCSFFGFWTGLKITRSAGFSITNNKFYQHIKYGISVESTNNNGDESDCAIIGNSIMSGLAAASPDAGINSWQQDQPGASDCWCSDGIAQERDSVHPYQYESVWCDDYHWQLNRGHSRGCHPDRYDCRWVSRLREHDHHRQ
jgi:hypothetical protein